MSQKLLDAISKCSQKAKQNIAEFLRGLRDNDEKNRDKKQASGLQQIFTKHTMDFSLSKAREVSKGQRNEKLLMGHQFNYGQITFQTIQTVFRKISQIRQPKMHQVFYDLGSGTGKVVFAASLCFPFKKCIGIQFLKTLCDFSLHLKEKVAKQKQDIEAELEDIENTIVEIPQINFINADFKEADWSDGTVIFVSSTCYTKQMMGEIQKLCFKLQPGTIIVSLTRRLEETESITLVSQFQGSTSWGTSAIFIHMKRV